MKCEKCGNSNATCWINTKHVCRICYYKQKLKGTLSHLGRTRTRKKLGESSIKHLKLIQASQQKA